MKAGPALGEVVTGCARWVLQIVAHRVRGQGPKRPDNYRGRGEGTSKHVRSTKGEKKRKCGREKVTSHKTTSDVKSKTSREVQRQQKGGLEKKKKRPVQKSVQEETNIKTRE